MYGILACEKRGLAWQVWERKCGIAVSVLTSWIQEKFSDFEGGIMISSITSLASYVLLSLWQ